MEPEWSKIAREMLGVEKLDSNLSDKLDKVDRLTHTVDFGELRSRQLIALIVIIWQLGWFGKELPDTDGGE